MAWLVTDVANLGLLALGTFAGNMSRLLAVVAVGVKALAKVRTISGDVTRLVAVVACRLIRHVAVAGDVANSVAPVTSLMILLAFTCKMAGTVTLVAFIPPRVAGTRDGSTAAST